MRAVDRPPAAVRPLTQKHVWNISPSRFAGKLCRKRVSCVPPATHALKFTGRRKSKLRWKKPTENKTLFVYFSKKKKKGFKKKEKKRRRTKDGKLGKGGEDQTTTTEKKYMFKFFSLNCLNRPAVLCVNFTGLVLLTFLQEHLSCFALYFNYILERCFFQ